MDKKYEDSIHRTGRIGIIIGIILMKVRLNTKSV